MQLQFAAKQYEPTTEDWIRAIKEDPVYVLSFLLYYWPWTLAVLVAITVIWPIMSSGAKSTSAPIATQTQDDEQLYATINRLVAYFVRAMSDVGNPGNSNQRPKFYAKHTLVDVTNTQVSAPTVISFKGKAWWIGNSCITPAGEWEYIGNYLTYREGSHDEFSAWWVVSSKYLVHSLQDGDPKPFNMYLVYDAGEATLSHALERLAGGMEQLLAQHNSASLDEFRRIRTAT